MKLPLETITSVLLVTSVAAPLLGFSILALRALLFNGGNERVITTVARASFLFSIFSLLGLVGILTWGGLSSSPELTIHWFKLGHTHYEISFSSDNFSLSFLAIVAILGGLSSTFSETYLHQEKGFERFYILLLLATFGMNLVVAANNLSLIVIGWEFLGIASTLLIAFFYTRRGPLVNAYRAFIAYRIADVGFLLALLYAHYSFGESNIVRIITTFSNTSTLHASPSEIALIFGSLLLFAAVGKSSILPFYPWLPRAMEGPTPSSALFYGAFATHAGPFLLLRLSPVLSQSFKLSVIMIVLGTLSAIFSMFAGRVRPDIKTSLAYASLTQVSFIYIEIGLGWYTLATIHIAGHMCLRTYQFMRAPSALHDQHVREVLGVENRDLSFFYDRIIPEKFQTWLYRLAFEQGGIVLFYEHWVVRPLVKIAKVFSQIETKTERILEKSMVMGFHRPTHRSPEQREAL